MRPATPGDADAICTIYNQGIDDRLATVGIYREQGLLDGAWIQ